MSYGFLRDKQDAQGRRPGEEGYDKSTLKVKLRGDERFTPAQQQYWDIKKNYADMIIFFKMGTPHRALTRTSPPHRVHDTRRPLPRHDTPNPPTSHRPSSHPSSTPRHPSTATSTIADVASTTK